VVFAVLWLHSMVTTQMPRYAGTIGLAVALYTVAAYCGINAARAALLATVVPVSMHLANQVDRFEPDQQVSVALGFAAFNGLLYGAAWIAGRWARTSRQHAADLERRRREAVNAERVRIARELHDIVSHSVTVMLMQAGGAQAVLTTDLVRAEQALARITECGTNAMGELSRMLRVLRTDDAEEVTAVTAEPQPGLAEVDAILDTVRGAGVAVELGVVGTPRPLDSSVDLTAYRVVQEGLTNVARHAGPGARTTVTLRWGDDLVVEVTNDAGGKAPHRTGRLSTGHGLLGLRERVSVSGGSLHGEPLADGGFRLVASLPLAASAGGPLSVPAG
jgi:signal transduction histidine kinase